MTSVDLVIIAILIVGAFLGYREGFLMELFSFLAIILGILGAFKLLGMAIVFLADRFDLDEKILPYVAFGIVFLAIVLLVRLVGNMIKLSIDKSFLGRVDQAAGAVLGFFKTAFLLSVVIWIVDSLHIDYPQRWASDSWLFPKIAEFAPVLTAWISTYAPPFKDVF